MPNFLKTTTVWNEIIQNVKTGAIYDGEYIAFFNENFYDWAMRLLR